MFADLVRRPALALILGPGDRRRRYAWRNHALQQHLISGGLAVAEASRARGRAAIEAPSPLKATSMDIFGAALSKASDTGRAGHDEGNVDWLETLMISQAKGKDKPDCATAEQADPE